MARRRGQAVTIEHRRSGHRNLWKSGKFDFPEADLRDPGQGPLDIALKILAHGVELDADPVELSLQPPALSLQSAVPQPQTPTPSPFATLSASQLVPLHRVHRQRAAAQAVSAM